MDINDEITILLVSSSFLAQKGIERHFQDESEITTLGQASNKIEMMLKIHEDNPSLIIINNDQDDENNSKSLATLNQAIREFPSMKFLLIINSYDVEKELLALKNGAKGILTENFDHDSLIECIKTVAKGGFWIRKKVMEKFITEQLFIKRFCDTKISTLPSFTKRELEIIKLAISGQKNSEIGENLYISEKTVKHHLTKVFRKLKIKKRIQLKGLI